MTAPAKRIGRASALGYTALSVVAAFLFFQLARWLGETPALAVWGGTAWVFVLSMIISMPLVTGWIKRRASETNDEGGAR